MSGIKCLKGDEILRPNFFGCLHFWIFKLFFFLLRFLVIKTLDPDSEPDSLEMQDLDPYADPQQCQGVRRILGDNLNKDYPMCSLYMGFLSRMFHVG
jgi:hypothetical protein